jgi:hypothetical protein
LKIYLACGLTHVPRDHFEEYVAFIHSLAANLARELGADIKYALRDSDPQLTDRAAHDRARLCYVWDRQMVEQADIVVAECSYPSTGVGIELQIAENAGKPIIICYQESPTTRATPASYINPGEGPHELQIGEGYVTLMALGLPTVHKVVAYNDFTQGLEQVALAASVLRKD